MSFAVDFIRQSHLIKVELRKGACTHTCYDSGDITILTAPISFVNGQPWLDYFVSAEPSSFGKTILPILLTIWLSLLNEMTDTVGSNVEHVCLLALVNIIVIVIIVFTYFCYCLARAR